jgi:hypothetical protein
MIIQSFNYKLFYKNKVMISFLFKTIEIIIYYEN